MKKISSRLTLIILTAFSLRAADELTVLDGSRGGPTEELRGIGIVMAAEGALNFKFQRRTPGEALAALQAKQADLALLEFRDIPADFAGIKFFWDTEILAVYADRGCLLEDIKLNELRRLYLAENPSWKSLTGSSAPLVWHCLKHRNNDYPPDQRLLGKSSGEEHIRRFSSPVELFDLLLPGNLALAPLVSPVPPALKLLKVDGVPPALWSAKDGSYPLAKRYYLVFSQASPALRKYLVRLRKKN